MHYVDVCCWVGLGRVRNAYISGLGWVCKLMGWVWLGRIIENGPTTMSATTTLLNSVISNGLEWLSKIFNDTKRRAFSMRQLSFLFSFSRGGGYVALVPVRVAVLPYLQPVL